MATCALGVIVGDLSHQPRGAAGHILDRKLQDGPVRSHLHPSSDDVLVGDSQVDVVVNAPGSIAFQHISKWLGEILELQIFEK